MDQQNEEKKQAKNYHHVKYCACVKKTNTLEVNKCKIMTY